MTTPFRRVLVRVLAAELLAWVLLALVQLRYTS